MIDDYGYLNARVRGMSTRLLGDEVFPALLEAGGLEGFATRLSESAEYRRLLEQQRSERGGLDVHAVESALLQAFSADVGKVRQISAGAPRALIDLFVARYDVHNTRTLVRGLLRGRPTSEVMQGTIPLGAFTQTDLVELAAAEDVRSLASTLVTWDMEVGRVITEVLRHAGAEEDVLLRIDLALDASWFPWAVEEADRTAGGSDMANALRAEIDLRNLVTMLKLVRQGADAEHALRLLIPAGSLSDRFLADFAGAGDLRTAIEMIGRSRYAEAVSATDLSGAIQVSEVERAVERLLVTGFSKLFRKDPLGFPTILGYLWRRYAEFTDLRLIARGQAYGLPGGEVRAQMVHA